MGYAWRVKLPPYAFLHEGVSQGLLVPIRKVVQDFLFSCNEVGTIVRQDDARDLMLLRSEHRE